MHYPKSKAMSNPAHDSCILEPGQTGDVLTVEISWPRRGMPAPDDPELITNYDLYHSPAEAAASQFIVGRVHPTTPPLAASANTSTNKR